jgi:hypothetical protein
VAEAGRCTGATRDESPDRGGFPRFTTAVTVGVTGLATELARVPLPAVGVGVPPIEPMSGEGPVGVACDEISSGVTEGDMATGGSATPAAACALAGLLGASLG